MGRFLRVQAKRLSQRDWGPNGFQRVICEEPRSLTRPGVLASLASPDQIFDEFRAGGAAGDQEEILGPGCGPLRAGGVW